MVITGVDAFDRTLQKTRVWLNEIMDEMGWNDLHRAYLALRSILHLLRDRLMINKAIELGAQLPLLVRGIYFEGWNPSVKSARSDGKEQVFDRIQKDFQNDPDINPEQVLKGIFAVLSRRIARGELQNIEEVLPEELSVFWPWNRFAKSAIEPQDD
jgi:uncharacterized protein (DUF2267 family)